MTLETEVASARAMLAQEKQHRQELEKKVDEEALGGLQCTLDEHRTTVMSLREEVVKTRQEFEEERGRALKLEAELAGLRKELVAGKQVVEECQSKLVSQEDLCQELKASEGKNEELRAQCKTLQQDARKMIEQCEREVGERAKAEQLLARDREALQREAAELRGELARERRRAEDLRLLQEQSARSLAAAREAAEGCEDLQQQLRRAQEDVRTFHGRRDELHGELERVSAELRGQRDVTAREKAKLEELLEDRNNEIKLLMYRVQELSSKYAPLRGDPIDTVLSKWINGYKPAVPFFRLAQGLYLFGRRQVICKISNDKPVFRVGGGFIGFDKFLELYASEELERLLTYETDERTGEPRFVEAQKVRQVMEESGAMQDLRERAEQLQATRCSLGGGGGGAPPGGYGSCHPSARSGGATERRRSPSAGGS